MILVLGLQPFCKLPSTTLERHSGFLEIWDLKEETFFDRIPDKGFLVEIFRIEVALDGCAL